MPRQTNPLLGTIMNEVALAHAKTTPESAEEIMGRSSSAMSRQQMLDGLGQHPNRLHDTIELIRTGRRILFITPEVNQDEILTRLAGLDLITQADLRYNPVKCDSEDLAGDTWWDEIKRRSQDRMSRHEKVMASLTEPLKEYQKSCVAHMLNNLPDMINMSRQTGNVTRVSILQSMMDKQLMERRRNKEAIQIFRSVFKYDLPVINSAWSKTRNGIPKADKVPAMNLSGIPVTVIRPVYNCDTLKRIADRAAGVNEHSNIPTLEPIDDKVKPYRGKRYG